MHAPDYSRLELLFGPEALDRLKNLHVVVAGLGAVGSFATESLARSAVGHLTLIDFDAVHSSNINRQLFALPSTIGHPKIELAADRVRLIQPSCCVTPLHLFINAESVDRVIALQPDILIDAIDSLNPKICLLEACVKQHIQVISAMGAATRTDPSCIRVDDISATRNCPLARFVRKRLRRRMVHSGIRCVYSIEKARPESVSELTDDASGELRAHTGAGRVRHILGSCCSIPAMFGMAAAQEALNLSLNLEAPHAAATP